MTLAKRVLSFQPHRLFFGWYIALAGAISNFFVISISVFGLGVFYLPMREEMGWSMAAIMVGVSLKSFEGALLSPISGYLIDRLGPRRMAMTGITLLTVGLLMFSQAQTIWFYYMASMVIALGQAFGPMTCFSLTLMNWFQKMRGLAISVLNTGNALSYLAVPVLALLVSTIGWRATLAIVAVTVFAFVGPLTIFLRPRPEPYGYLPDGERLGEAAFASGSRSGATDSRGKQMTSGTGLTVAQAIRTPAFWLLVLAGAFGGSGHNAWVSNQIPHLQSVGYSLAAAGMLVAFYGAVQVPLRLGSGWLGDSIGRRRLFMASFLLQGIGLVFFANLTKSRTWLFPFYLLIFGLGHASWIVGGQTIVADYFGTLRYATIRGVSQALNVPLSLVTPVFAGWMFDQTGSYRLVFTIYAAVIATGALWTFLIRQPLWSAMASKSQDAALS